MRSRHAEKSRSLTEGWFTNMLIMVGTISETVTRSASTVRANKSGSNPAMQMWAPPTKVKANVLDASAA